MVGKTKDETSDVATEESVGLKLKICSYLVTDISAQKQKVWKQMLLRQ